MAPLIPYEALDQRPPLGQTKCTYIANKGAVFGTRPSKSVEHQDHQSVSWLEFPSVIVKSLMLMCGSIAVIPGSGIWPIKTTIKNRRKNWGKRGVLNREEALYSEIESSGVRLSYQCVW